MSRTQTWAVKARKGKAAAAVEFDGKRKRCKGPCREKKPLSEFSPQSTGRDGVRPWCRVCHAAREKQRYRESDRFVNYHSRFNVTDTHRTCSKCKVRKKLGEFSWSRTGEKNTNSVCKMCVSKMNHEKAPYGTYLEYRKQIAKFDEYRRVKQCSKCKEMKSFDLFGPLKKGIKGRHSRCRECIQRGKETPKGRSYKLVDAMQERAS